MRILGHIALPLLSASIVLAVVFAVAGTAKLLNLARSRKAITDFGVPVTLAHLIGSLLPFAELAVAALLIPAYLAWWGSVGAVLLLLTFIVAITVNLVQGRAPDCQCFGQIHSKPIGWPTLVRNGVLAVGAGLIVWAGPSRQPSVVGWLADLTSAQTMAAGVTAIVVVALGGQTWLVLHLFRQHGRVMLRMDNLEKRLRLGAAAAPSPSAPTPLGLPLGAPAPVFALPALSGTVLELSALLQHWKPLVLIFSDPNCGPCTSLLPDIGRWQRELDRVTVAVISRGAEKANRAKVTPHDLHYVLLQQDREVADAYEAHGTPTAVLIRADGTIGSRVVTGAEGITHLVPISQNAASGPMV